MVASVYHLADVPAVGARGVLAGPEGRHAVTVRRTVAGERIVLSDGRGTLATVEVTGTARDTLDFVVDDVRTVPAPTPPVTVVQALPKSDRAELAVESATEAGVDVVVPWQASRCVSRWSGPKAEKGVTKWRHAALAAAKQSRRALFPEVTDLASTADVLDLVAGCVRDGGVALALHESAREPLAGAGLRAATRIVLVVGPEGGLSDEELAALSEAGARPTVLGPTVLRTSTAASVALGAIGVLTDRWSGGSPLAVPVPPSTHSTE